MKVLHLPTPVGGNSWGLAQGERALGLESRVLVTAGNWIEYPADVTLGLERHSPAVKLARLLETFLRERKAQDVFHFNAGMSLIHSPHRYLNLVDLPFYPKGTGLFVTYNGCDARQKFPTIARTQVSACHVAECNHGLCEFGRYDGLRRKAIAKMARYVHHMWALNPDLLHFLPPEKSSFLPYTVSPTHALSPVPPRLQRRLRIVHAPTNRAAKGSGQILAALERIRASHGDLFELVLIENIPHRDALTAYADADLVIDQILVGWYGGVAVEAMMLGKPVIARIAREDLHFLPADMARDLIDTIIDADPASIEETLRRCIEDRDFLRRRALAGPEYASRWHDPVRVARITKAAYEAALCAA